MFIRCEYEYKNNNRENGYVTINTDHIAILDRTVRLVTGDTYQLTSDSYVTLCVKISWLD